LEPGKVGGETKKEEKEKNENEGIEADTNDNTVALVKLVTEIGPDIAEISRRLGQYKESTRYRYKEKLVKRGFAIKADLDYGALGLRRIVMKLKMTTSHGARMHEIFEAMSEQGYLVAYAGTTMPGEVYIVHAGVPVEFTSEYHLLMESLKERGIFSSVELFDCDWFRVAPMRAECFDFDAGVWDFDWSNPPAVDERAARATISERKEVDLVDLLILKELWRNSDRSLVEIQASIRKLNAMDVNYKTLAWHYKRHVQARKLVRDYSIAWHGLQYNFLREKAGRLAKHAYLGVSFIVRNTDERDKMSLRSRLNRLPFQWSEAAGEAYYSQLFFPLTMANEGLDYLKTLLRPFGERAELFLLDQSEMASFTIGYKLWDDRQQRWTFDRRALLSRLEESVLKIG
jgi:DNA-binding Lrp family transcriptional regulator